jgi:hypothetical protein
MFNFLKKTTKQKDFFAKLKRQERNRRYYLRHRDEILQKRKEYYQIHGK